MPDYNNPYVGPRVFARDEADRFFGREEEANDLRSLVVTERLTLFYAQSGAGKSSLINTRLIPQLQKTGFAVLPVGRVSGELPEEVTQVENIFVFNLLRSLHQGDVSAGRFSHMSLGDFLARLISEDGEYYYFDETVIPEDVPDEFQEHRHVLIIDQFEEIITTHPEHWSEREDFFKQLNQAMLDDPALEIVLTLREDNLAALEPYASLIQGKMRARYYMQRLSTEAALEAIQKPAALENRPFTPEAAQILVDNLRQIKGGKALGQFVEPVQLQVVCFQLWENLRDRPAEQITVQDVQEVGDVDQALTMFYENAIRHALEQQAYSERRVREWFNTKLITPARTRGLAYRGEHTTEGLDNTIIDRLTDAHIVRAENRGGEVWYELTHDRLIEPILEANLRWQLSYHNPVAIAYQAWLNSKRDPQKLLRGEALIEAQTYIKNHPNEITADEQIFMTESQRQDDYEKIQAEQAAKRTKVTIIAALIVAAIMGWLAFWGWNQAIEAQTKEKEAVAALATAESAQRSAENSAATAEYNEQLATDREAEAETARLSAQYEAAEAEIAKQTAVAAQNEAVVAQKTAEARREEVEEALQQVASAEEVAALERQEATTQKKLADSRRLALAALENIEIDPELSILLAIHALARARTVEAENALHEAVRASRLEINMNPGSSQYSVAFSPKGTYAASGGKDGFITVWDTATGQTISTLTGHTGQIFSIEYSPSGEYIASSSDDKTIRLWSSSSNETQRVLSGHDDTVSAVIFSPDGKRIVSSSWDGTIKIWDVETGQELNSLSGQESEIISNIAISEDGNWLASASLNNTVKLWDVVTGEELKSFTGHAAPIGGVAFSPDGTSLLSAGMDRQIKFWDVSSGEEMISLTGHTDHIANITFSHNGDFFASAGADGKVKLWNSETKRVILELAGHADEVFDVDFNPDDSQIASASRDDTVRIWDISDDDELTTINDAHVGRIYSIAFSPDDKNIITAGQDSTIKMWDTFTGTQVFSTTVEEAGRIFGAEFISADGTRFATVSGDGKIRLWQAGAVEQNPQVLSGHRGVANDLAAWIGDGEQLIATASSDRTAKLWDANSGEVLRTFEGHSDNVLSVAISPDGRKLATASQDTTAKVWDLDTGKEIFTLEGHLSHVVDVAFSPDGSQLATVGLDRVTILWNLESGQEIATFSGHTNEINRVSFSPDGKRLATTSGDRTTKIWDIETGRELLTLTGHSAPVLDVDFSSDGKYLATSSENGEIRVYILDLDTLLSEANSRLTRDLTQEECQKFLELDTCPSLPQIANEKDTR